MKKAIQFRIVTTLVFLTTFFNIQIQSHSKLALPKDILAVVGSFKISVKEFQLRYNDYIFRSDIQDNFVLRKSVLQNMIYEIILKNLDDNSLILSNPDYRKEINWAEKQTLLAFLKDREVYAKISASENEIRDAFYKSQEKLEARHLFAPTEEEANSLYQQLQTGATFEKLAKEIFIDSTLANNGGYLGVFSWGDMDPNFENAAYALKVGEISKPVKTKFGFSVIKLEQRLPNPIMTESEFQKKSEHMEKIVKIRKKRGAEIEFLNKIFSEKELSIDEKILSNIYDNLGYSDVNKIEYQNPDSFSAVCVKYGSKKYTRREIEKSLIEIPVYHQEKINSLENLKTAIKGLVIQNLLLEFAKKKKYHKDPEVLSATNKYKENIFLRFKRKEISDKAEFAGSDIKKFYNDNSVYFMKSPELNVQEIIVSNKALADSLINEISKGSDFGILAEKYSIRSWSAKNKGIMDWAELDKFGILKDTLWNSPTGKIVGPIKIQDRFGIFRVLEKKESSVKEFEFVRTDALRLLKKEKSKEILLSYIDKLKKNINIEINEKLLSSIKLKIN